MSDSANPGADGASADADSGDGDDGGPAQVSSPDYHSENHTAAQTCGWTANALRGEGSVTRTSSTASSHTAVSR